jgi:cell division protein FtsN
MEQKQSLWIIAAVGVFLLVVIGAAVILYSPAAAKADSRTAVTSPVQQLPVQPVPQEAPVLQLQDLSALQLQQQQTPASSVQSVAPAQTATITAPDGSVISIPTQSPQYLALLQTLNVSPQVTSVQAPQYQSAPQSPVQNVNDLTVISGTTHVIGTGTTTFNGGAAPAAAPTEINIQTVLPINNMAREAVGESKTAPSTTPAPAKAPVVAATPAKATVPAKPVKTVATPAVTQYWVQAASFEAKKNADVARGTLEENSIPGEVFTYTGSDGKLLYRVRVGPYETKAEAERAQAELRRIKSFESNQTFVVNSAKQ